MTGNGVGARDRGSSGPGADAALEGSAGGAPGLEPRCGSGSATVASGREPEPGAIRALDTICAVATASGPAGVGVVRVSGPRAGDILGRLLGRDPSQLVPRQVMVDWVREPASGERLDQVIAFFLPGPRSFTGEDVAELQGHGGAWNMGRLLDAALAAGARLAAPGEFSRRAFENGRMDLTRAEGIALLVGAGGERAARLARRQLEGRLGEAVLSLRGQALDLRAQIEAQIDFPEEGLEFGEGSVVARSAAALAARILSLAGTYRAGRVIGSGLVVALVGPPNVGKSSLFNALLGHDRAIVTPEPGTTRDVNEARTVWEGIEVTLLDTAGVRDAVGEAERLGVVQGRQRAETADLVVHVRDCSSPGDRRPQERRDGMCELWNKADLAPAPVGCDAVSARTGQGLAEFQRACLERVLGPGGEGQEDTWVASARQHELLVSASEHLHAAAQGAVSGLALECVAEDLRSAALQLGRLTGQDADEAMLDALFARFCIGK